MHFWCVDLNFKQMSMLIHALQIKSMNLSMHIGFFVDHLTGRRQKNKKDKLESCYYEKSLAKIRKMY